MDKKAMMDADWKHVMNVEPEQENEMEAKHKTEINFAARHMHNFPNGYMVPILKHVKDWVLIKELMSRGYQFDYDNPAFPYMLKALKGMVELNRGTHEPTTAGLRIMNAEGVIAMAEGRE